MASKAELEQKVADLEEELAQANEDHDLASARLVTLERESSGRIDALQLTLSAEQRRSAELESVLNATAATAALLALRCVGPKLADRIAAVAK